MAIVTVSNDLFDLMEINPAKFLNSNEILDWISSLRWFPKNQDVRNSCKVIFNRRMKFRGGQYYFSLIELQEELYNLSIRTEVLEQSEKQTKTSEYPVLIMENESSSKRYIVYESEYSPDYWKLLSKGVVQRKTNGFIRSSREHTLYRMIQDEEFEIRVLGTGDTTNIVIEIRFNSGQSIFAKAYKKVGKNLEVSILQHLKESDFPHCPDYYTSLVIDLGRQQRTNVLFREFVHGNLDVGGLIWGELKNYIDKEGDLESVPRSEFKEFFSESLNMVENVGEITAKLHAYLSEPGSDDWFSSSEFSEESLKKEFSDVEALIAGEIKNKAIETVILSQISDWSNVITKNLKLVGKQPIHQDLHLGQILVEDDSFKKLLILDFEGDPQLGSEQKFDKYPIFQDLASLIRAFSYIKYSIILGEVNQITECDVKGTSKSQIPDFRCFIRERLGLYTLNTKMETSLRTLADNIQGLRIEDGHKPRKEIRDLIIFCDRWEKQMVDSLLRSYFHTSKLPIHYDEQDQEIRKAMWFYLLKRTLSELEYEKKYRPQNLKIPVLGLIDLVASDDLEHGAF